MKKTICYALLLFLLAAVLLGCGEEQAQPDYTSDIQQWMHMPESNSETMDLLITIDTCRYGSAGASFSQASAAVSLLKLTQVQDLEKVLEAYLNGMNATQLDYFSFQWQMCMEKAQSMLQDPEAFALLLEESGNGDTDLTAFDLRKLEALDDQIQAQLKSRRVTDAWKDHLDIEPFFHWTL